MAKGLSGYAVVLPGLEALAAEELRALGGQAVECEQGGVRFRGSPDAFMRICTRARTITRVLLRLATFQVRTFPALQRKLRQIDWQEYLNGRQWSVHVTARRSRLWHTGRIGDLVEEAVVRQASPGEGTPVAVHVRLEEDRCMLSLCASWPRMDRRGYRLEPGPAPMRETLAAALVQWSGWPADAPLWVPMCGSGTWAIEAALAARRMPVCPDAPPCVGWPGFPPRRWQRVQLKVQQMRADPPSLICASDLDAALVELARRNAKRAGLDDAIRWACEDFFALEPSEREGWMLLNPPYGRRIGARASALYARIGRHLRERFSGWHVLIITPDVECAHALKLAAQRQLRFRHGGRWVGAMMFDPI